jgi:16S rRNA (adenine1518-N6/adenine1519-N6)-dimethyltransferase
VVELVPRPVPLPCDVDILTQVAQAAFGQRRKMLRQSLKALDPDPVELLTRAHIEPVKRAEEIDVAGFVRLAQELQQRRAGHIECEKSA